MLVNTAILGTGSYLPEKVLTSAELGKRLGVDEHWILSRTGIKERRIAAHDEATSDLAARAAETALHAASIGAEDVDLIVLATATKDKPIPATASIVQAKIGATRAGAFDIDAACTGFIYGLTAAHSMLMANPNHQTALVIGAELYSRFLDYEDRRTCVLLGDGAGAIVLAKTEDGEGLLSTTLVSEGTQADLVQIPAGGSQKPASTESVDSKEHFLTMRGREVRNLAAKVMPDLIGGLLKSAELELEDVRLIVPHQANGIMLTEWAGALHLPPGQMHTTVRNYGNTGAASVPITLDDGVRNHRIVKGDAVLLVAFGGGMTWGGATMRWTMDGTR
ncbi:beta-ketoacyl-ACP synthase III [Haloechinothrix salitolerans]|uniref:3-oxoacyl-ACP synthase III family protein n=1 Tax=Haloechinothrix salitolerans TaxID=926830 RepID=A0ABW2BYT3_9PSEU